MYSNNDNLIRIHSLRHVSITARKFNFQVIEFFSRQKLHKPRAHGSLSRSALVFALTEQMLNQKKGPASVVITK